MNNSIEMVRKVSSRWQPDYKPRGISYTISYILAAGEAD